MLPLQSKPPSLLKELPKIRKKKQIIKIQTKERIPRLQAIRKLLRLDPNPEIIFSNAVKTPLSQLERNPRKVSNKKVSLTLVVGTKARLKQARISQEFVDNDLIFIKNSGEKKATHRLYRPTDTSQRKKEKNEPTLSTVNCKRHKIEKTQKINFERM